MKSGITWRRTFPECEPGTDGVALFEGRFGHRPSAALAELRDPRPWMWSVTDPTLAGQGITHGEMPSRRQAMERLIERWQELRRLKAT